ncbi:MAG: uracil-DNA glycosylase family protein [Bacteroides sp.]|nr:uracil-DNA glycosylase family protein [Bacteroides sp.]
MSTQKIEAEIHPLQPFLPANARLLMLGSFPPQRKRWSMEFYYPNLNNDMWRIFGLVFFGDKNYFLREDQKAFQPDKLRDFLTRKGVAIFDTARSIRRLQDNASDKFLEVVEPTNIGELLDQIPLCQAIVTTGQKATDTLRVQFDVEKPKVGHYTEFHYKDRVMRLYRMPSTSRAYPLALEKKAVFYREMFAQLQLIP